MISWFSCQSSQTSDEDNIPPSYSDLIIVHQYSGVSLSFVFHCVSLCTHRIAEI